MFNIAQRELFSNMFNFLVSSWGKDQVSEPYIAVDSINALYNHSFNFVEMSLRDHTLPFRLPKAELVITIHLFTSNDELKFFNSFNIFIFYCNVYGTVRNKLAFIGVYFHSTFFTDFS